VACSAELVSYRGHKVHRCIPSTDAQLKALRDADFDFWAEPRIVGTPVDIATKPSNNAAVTKFLGESGMACWQMIADVQSIMDEERKTVANKDTPFLENYHTYTDVYAYFDSLAASYPNLATTSTIGKTYYGKDIRVIHISTDPAAKKPALWFDGGLHAREWIAVATVTWMADSLIRNYANSTDSILNDFDVYFAPILNADGYDYTWTTDRNWRKTISPNGNHPCIGTDPNRNWEFHWGEAGTSTNKCSDSYQGPSAASEVEVQAIQKFLCDHKDTLKGYVNFHSYSQLWMSPWGWTDAYPADYEQQNALSAAVAKAIFSVHGTRYEYGPISTTIYPASGSSADYTYGVCGIKYSYGAELRDTGRYGFLLPADQIVPSGEETLAGIIAMANFIKANP